MFWIGSSPLFLPLSIFMLWVVVWLLSFLYKLEVFYAFLDNVVGLPPFCCAFSIMKKVQTSAWLVHEQVTSLFYFHREDIEVYVYVNRL